MRSWLTATLVLALVLCILLIVVSPYVDLPLTTVRTCIAAVLFLQAFLLGGILSKPTLTSTPSRLSLTAAGQGSCGPPVPLLPLLCSYLC